MPRQTIDSALSEESIKDLVATYPPLSARLRYCPPEGSVFLRLRSTPHFWDARRVRGYPFEVAMPAVRGVLLADQARSLSWGKTLCAANRSGAKKMAAASTELTSWSWR
jgi:hypothetical protein